MYGAAALAGGKRVVYGVQSAGAAIIPQLWHVGAFRRPGVGPYPPVLGVGPTRVIENGKPGVERLSRVAIAEIVLSYGRAARAAADTGFGGIEFHGAHGYLLAQFLWSVSNRRREDYDRK